MLSIIRRADKDYLHEILDEVTAYLERHHCSGDFIFETQLIVEELFTNTCYYAYLGDEPEQNCEFRLTFEETELKIQRIDSGYAFNPLTLTKPDTESGFQERKVGGLGMYLVSHYCSRMLYERIKDKNVLTLYRSLAPRKKKPHTQPEEKTQAE